MTPRTIIVTLMLSITTSGTFAAAKTAQPPVAVWNTPAELRALQAFNGSDGRGKDGAMGRIGYDLNLLFQEYREFILAGGAAVLKHPFRPSQRLARVRDETVVIDAVAVDDAGWLAQGLAALGMENPAIYGKMVSGRLPIAALEQAAQLGSLRLARPAYAVLMAGSVTSQGDAAMLSDDARSGFAVDGTGVMIGTLSDSYDCLGGAAADVASSDLPTGIQVLADEAGCGSGSDEGRAMMQIIHDVAPGASLAFHTAFNGSASFASGIVDLATVASADIINDDVIYLAEPMFQDGIIAQAVDTVVSMGVAYFSAAGNQADQSYEDTFRNSGASGAFGGLRHDFDPGAGTTSLMQVTIPGNTLVILVLQWDDPYFSVSGSPGADTDMDIVLYSNRGQVKAYGIDNNLGGDPIEILSYATSPGPARTYQIGIEHYAGPFPGRIKFVYFNEMSINEFDTRSGTSYGHAMAAGARAVGAARYSQTPEYGVSPPLLEYFSSRGGIPILFDTGGNLISELRQKPEIVAPDGGNNTFFGSDYTGDADSYPNFFGTSAAAPHAAGMAALLKQFDGSLGPDALYNALQSTAIDMGASGVDIDSGYGMIQAVPALASLDDDLDTVPDTADNCPTVANQGQENNDGDAQGDACDEDDDNDGLTDNEEVAIGSDPFLGDTDGDTLSDGDEVNLYTTDPLLADSDGDGIDDGTEITAGSDPNSNTSIPGQASGDVNGDGAIDTADVLLAYRIAVEGLMPGTNQLLRGDIAPLEDGVPVPDGIINAADLLVIQQLVLESR